MAIDEVAIEVPDSSSVDDVVAALAKVDGVAVEDVHSVDVGRLDHSVMGLDVLTGFVDSGCDLETLARGLGRLLESDWLAVVDRQRAQIVATIGFVPDPAWLMAFVAGTEHLEDASSEHTPSDVIWTNLAGTDLSVACERRGRAFRAREREHVAAIGRLAGVALRVVNSSNR